MAAMYGTYLKTDMVSVAHHGGVGVTAEFYDLVSPTVVWWSNQTNSVYDAYLNPNGTAWNYKVDQHLAYDVDSVQYIYVADDYHITLVLKEDGPDHNGIYNATDKEAIDCHSVSKAGLKTGSASAESDRKSLCSNKHVAIKKI